MEGAGVDNAFLKSSKRVYPTCNLFVVLSLKVEFNSNKNESKLLLISYPAFWNCKIEALGPLNPNAVG